MKSLSNVLVVAASFLLAATASAFTCPSTPSGTVYFRAGDELRAVNTATNAITTSTLTRAGVDRNAMAWDRATGSVYASGGGTDNSVATLNNDGTFTLSTFSLSSAGFAGGTALPGSRWLVAAQPDSYEVRSVAPGSGFGALLASGTFSPTTNGGVSGDLAYRSSDNRVYFIGPISSPTRIGWIDPTTFAVTYGPTIAWPSSATATGAGPLGFDADGNLFAQITTTGSVHTFFKFSAGAIGAASGTVAPQVIGSATAISGTDGFSCVPTPDTPVPTLGQWSLWGLALLMMVVVASQRRVSRKSIGGDQGV
ncbi:MAG: IPTL-CTERM sorting domain-containing protein [Burkholderiales bacterium]|nr:MAG: IPTL-CTERM sorting domain-containing protein [Burkholderiales bacterium]